MVVPKARGAHGLQAQAPALKPPQALLTKRAVTVSAAHQHDRPPIGSRAGPARWRGPVRSFPSATDHRTDAVHCANALPPPAASSTAAPDRLLRRAVLNGKKVFRNQFSQKSPRALHVLNHLLVAVGGWRLAAVGGGWQLAVGNWWLVVVGGWRWLAAVGSWRLVVPWGGP